MIEMIAGVFGLPVDGIVKAMDKNSGPFEAGIEQETRLVKLGLARYVAQAQDEDSGTPIGFDETPPEDFTEDADETEDVEEPFDLENLSAKELREIGKEYGLTFKANTKKEDMIAAIAEAQAKFIEDGEDAPSFDAAEAVL